MIELYHNDMSVCAQKVRITLFEKELEWESRFLNLRTGDQFNADYLKLNPAAVVPTLVHDGNVVTESNRIIEYLDEQFPSPPLAPVGGENNKKMHHWFDALDTRIHPMTGVLSIGVAFRHEYLAEGPEAIEKVVSSSPDEVKREGKRALIEQGIDAPFFKAAVAVVDGFLNDMDRSLSETGWLAGPDYSLADIALMPYLARFHFLGLDAFWADRPHLADWMVRVKSRPCFEKVLIDDVAPTRMSNLIAHGKENAARLAAMRT